MPQFAILMGGVDIDRLRGDLEPGSPLDRYKRWVESLAAAGRLVEGQKLRDGEGYRVRSERGAIVDGPFTETKETITSFFIVRGESYEDVMELARGCPAATEAGGYVEVRKLVNCPMNPMIEDLQ